MSHHRRFLFAEDFAERQPPAPPLPPPPPPPGFSAADVAAARAAGVAEGQAAGLRAADAAHHAIMADLLAAIAGRLDAAEASRRQAAQATALALAQLLTDALAAVFPTLRQRTATAELHRVAAAVLPPLLGEPDVVVRVNPAQAAALAQQIAAMPAHAGPVPRIETLEALPPGDAVILWRDGRMLRDAAAICADVTAILREVCAS